MITHQQVIASFMKQEMSRAQQSILLASTGKRVALISSGDAGIYVNPHDIASISTGLATAIGPKRTDFIKLGLAQAKKFSWSSCAKQTLRVLESAI